MAGISFCVGTIIARFVQRLQDCVKTCFENYTIVAELARTTTCSLRIGHVSKVARSALTSQFTSDHGVEHYTTLHNHQRGTDLPRSSRTLAIGEYAASLTTSDPFHEFKYDQRRKVLTCTITVQDLSLLPHQEYFGTATNGSKYNVFVLNLPLIFFHWLRNSSGRRGVWRLDKVESAWFRNLAAVEHFHCCLTKTVLVAVSSQYVSNADNHIMRSHAFWRNRKPADEGWFAEWPNNQRPLNTTWPWNIKTSLLVLWGVCWMFYGPSRNSAGNSNVPGTTRNQQGAAQQNELSGDFRTRQPSSVSQPIPQAPHQGSLNAWVNPSSFTYPNYSWLHPQQAGVNSRRANVTPSQAIAPTYQTSAPSYSYITSASSGSSDPFAAASAQWPHDQGINPDPPPVYASDFTPWQSTYNITENLTATPPRIGSQTPLQSYAPQRRANTNPETAVGDSGSLGFGLGLGLRLQDMQDYPSPHSNVSEQTTSSCLSVLPGAMMSPGGHFMPSPSVVPSVVPSVGGSSDSRQSSRRSTEAPRNAQGVLYCSHPECARQPPVFSRKCEWTKHMDKHTRPYVCEEPECENIRGFTYSGGLLRHQREVHRQHGGPKASCMCPYKDCKRSTGVGFSRKENLNEHLRRCHQPQGESQVQSPVTHREEAPSSRPRKRRRNASDDDDPESEEPRGSQDDLQREVKKLKRELAEKDERLKRLERMMEALTRGQSGLQK